MTGYYVHRERTREDSWTGELTTQSGWIGPIDAEDQANHEVDAWQSCGWTAEVHPDSIDVRARVEAWETAQILSWKDSTDASQRGRYWEFVEQRPTGCDCGCVTP